MLKKTFLGAAIVASFATSFATAEPHLETSIVLKNETAYMLKDGIRTGEETSVTDTTGSGKGVYKFENTAQVFVNGEIGENSSWHGEFKAVRDGKATNGYKGHMNMSQQDYLRELYVDTTAGDWDLRIGKQQVVWGTADGIKLLDMMNPTDWREFNQNTMAESRIPVWMVNAEKYLDNGANIQIIGSIAEKNVIAGLNSSGDQGHPFVMKGVDSITGKVNGFLNVTPALANVATSFDIMASMGGFAMTSQSKSSSLTPFTSMTVDGFGGNTITAGGGYYVVTETANIDASAYGITAGDTVNLGVMLASGQQAIFSSAALAAYGITAPTNWYTSGSALTTGDSATPDYFTYAYTSGGSAHASAGGATVTYASATSGTTLLYNTSETGTSANDYATANSGQTNLVDSTWGIEIPDAAFEYMPMATFATFNTFAGMTTRYIEADKTEGNVGFRFKNSTANGLNYSFNYAYRADSNPYIDLYYRDRSSGERLSVEYVSGGNANGLPVYQSGGSATIGGTLLSASELPTAIQSYTSSTAASAFGADFMWYKAGAAQNAVTVLVKDSSGNYYGSRDWNGTDNTNSYNDIEMVFEEKQNRVHNIGGSFDFAVDTNANPLVIRGEALYTKGEMTPVINRHILAHGDLANSLTMKESDTFKYVIGADTTILTDMMLSGQFIQFRNLDYVDNQKTCTTQMGKSVDCSTYTADMAVMHMDNQLQKAEENKEFYSLFLSKPFGDSGEGRWNNIFIYEEGGGKWNRFDVEYGINDQLIGTFEYNKYFGDNNTMFGQFENASNVQIGVKYLLQ